MAAKLPATFKLSSPRYSAADIQETPWYAVELQMYKSIARAVDSSIEDGPSLAAQELDLLTPMKRPTGLGPAERESWGSFLWELWEVFAKSASQIPAGDPAQDRLVNLVVALRDLPNPVRLKSQQQTYRLWADLPFFGPAMREGQDTVGGINFGAFLARMTRTGIVNFMWVGYAALVYALGSDQHEDLLTEVNKKNAASVGDWIVRAVWWVRIGGENLYADCRAGRESVGGTKQVYSMTKWAFWKKRFGEVAADEDEDAERRELARDAERVMNGIEEVHRELEAQ